MERYSRHIVLNEIGQAGQDRISAAKVLVVGAGGLGCPVLQYLAAAGIGTIGIVDFDTIEESNLQRQVLFGTASLGRKKAEVAQEVLSNLNSAIAIRSYTEKLCPQNVVSIFGPYDIIVDATDNFAARYLINDAAIVLDKPVVYGAIYKFEGQVTVFNYKNGPSYRCIFPNPPQRGTMPNCAEAGVLGVLPGIIGTLQANEVLKMVLELGDSLSGKLYCFNALNNQSYTLSFYRDQSEIDKVKARDLDFETVDSSFFCGSGTSEIELETLRDEELLFIDVRELHEQPRISLPNILEIPLARLSENLEKLPKDQKIIAFCKSGVRSKQAVSILKQNHLPNSFSLKEGANAFAKAKLKTLNNE